MDWNSLDEIIKEFDLTSGLNDLKGLNSELVSILVELHPDKTGGSFASPENEKKYYRVSSAIEFISRFSQDSKALIPISELALIIKAVSEAQILPKQTQISQFRKEISAENRQVLRSSYALPRIGSGVFASICLGLFTFSNALESHRIMGPILDNIISQIILLVLSVYAGIIFIFTWVRERKQEAIIESLLSEAGLREIFAELLEKGQRFTLRNVLDSIHSYYKSRYRLSPLDLFSIITGRPNIRSSIAEKIANMHLLELENRGAIHRLDIPSIEPTYQVDDNLNSYVTI